MGLMDLLRGSKEIDENEVAMYTEHVKDYSVLKLAIELDKAWMEVIKVSYTRLLKKNLVY